MARNFNLDPNAAKEANSGGKRITSTGKYIGTLTAAWYEQYPSGAEAVCFKFESDQGQEAGPLTLFTHGKDGQILGGYNMVQAIMTCAKVRGLESQKGKVKVYDFDQQQEVEKEKEVYPALTSKRIGIVLREEEYTDRDGYLKTRDDGTPKTRLIIAAPFEADAELMATEILEKATSPVALGKFMEWVTQNPIKGQKNAKRTQAGGGQYGGYAADPYQPPQGQQAAPAYEEFDDSIPF